MDVGEGGNTFSAGEKQLISLSRAILHNRPIVLMDEATANVDYETDELIQNTLRKNESFKNKTIFIIAHRIQTILECDIIAVTNLIMPKKEWLTMCVFFSFCSHFLCKTDKKMKFGNVRLGLESMKKRFCRNSAIPAGSP